MAACCRFVKLERLLKLTTAKFYTSFSCCKLSRVHLIIMLVLIYTEN